MLSPAKYMEFVLVALWLVLTVDKHGQVGAATELNLIGVPEAVATAAVNDATTMTPPTTQEPATNPPTTQEPASVQESAIDQFTPHPTQEPTAPATTVQEAVIDLSAEYRGTTFQIISPVTQAPDAPPAYAPFNFTYVYIIGGHCTKGDDTNDWYTKFVDAGMKTMKNVTKLICAEEADGAYTRDFHVDALKLVELEVGDKLDETLVITVAVGLETDWTPVADLLRKGMGFFHAKEDPINFNLTEFDLLPADVLYFYFRWDEFGAADRAGTELCRLKGGTEQLKVAKLYMGGRDGGLNYRVDRALQALSVACPDTEIVELWAMESGQAYQAYRSTLLFNPLPDLIMCGSDAIAEVILNVAEKELQEDQFSRLATTGWDNTHPELMDVHKILTTVDQMVHYADLGVWKSISTVADIMQTSGLNTTKSVQDELGLGDSLTVSADCLAISSDRVGFLIRNLLQGYDQDSPPYQDVTVSTGLLGVTITEMIPFEGKFQAVLWLRKSWNDPRLKFNPFGYEGTAALDSETIWVPQLYFKNGYSQEELYTGPAVVNHTGHVVMETNIVADFLCSTTQDLRSFPFDSYKCAIELGAPVGIVLNQDYGFDVVESDPHFTTAESMEVVSDQHNKSGEYGHGNTAYYNLDFDRRPFTAYVRLILPGVLINLVGFMAFWIPEVPESVALGVTSLLCSLAFRETVEMPDTADVTWTEVFCMLNISYQASVMVIIWISYGSAWTKSAVVDGKHWTHEKKIRLLACLRLREDKKESQRNLQTYGPGYSSRGIPLNDIVAPPSAEESSLKLKLPSKPKSRRASLGHVPFKVRDRRASLSDMSLRIKEEIDVEDEDEEIVIQPFIPPQAASQTVTVSTDGSGTSNSHDNHDRFPSDRQMSMGPAEIKKALEDALRNSERDGRTHDWEEGYPPNVDWIGRWIIVPSYICLMSSLLIGGWGFYIDPASSD